MPCLNFVKQISINWSIETRKFMHERHRTSCCHRLMYFNNESIITYWSNLFKVWNWPSKSPHTQPDFSWKVNVQIATVCAFDLIVMYCKNWDVFLVHCFVKKWYMHFSSYTIIKRCVHVSWYNLSDWKEHQNVRINFSFHTYNNTLLRVKKLRKIKGKFSFFTFLI